MTDRSSEAGAPQPKAREGAAERGTRSLEPLAPGALGGGLSGEFADLLPAARDELGEAFALAYRRLGRRDHTHIQLRERLVRAGFDGELVCDVLATLVEQGYVDDERFARRFVEDRRNLDGWGAQRIRAGLVAAGIAEATIAAQLDSRDAHDELAVAVSLLSRRLREPPQDERSRAKALGLLLRRGYDSDVAYEAVRAFERIS